MHFLKRLNIGIIITISTLFTNCEDRAAITAESDSTPLNSGAVIGSVYWVSGRQYLGNATVWLTNDNYTDCVSTPFITKTNAAGNFLIKVPPGAYDIHACGVIHYTSSSIVVSEGTTLDLPDLRISEIASDLCKSCY